MIRRARNRAAVALGLVGPLVIAAAAAAAPTVSYNSGVLTVSGDAADETIAVASDDAGRLTIDSAGMTASGSFAGSRCAVRASTVVCPTFAPFALTGNGGSDTITCTGSVRSASPLFGGSGNDSLSAGDCDIALNGESGNDTLIGGPGPDDFGSEAGADTYVGGSASVTGEQYARHLSLGREPVDFQLSQADSLSYYGTESVDVSLDGVADDGRFGEGDNVGTDIEEVRGSDGNDTLTANVNLPATLYGGLGDDRLVGGKADDRLFGKYTGGAGSGSDTFIGGEGDDEIDDADQTLRQLPEPGDPAPQPAGADSVIGGPGDDSIAVNEGADDVVGGDGIDRVAMSSDRFETLPVGASEIALRAAIGTNVSLDDIANDGVDGEGDNIHSDVENVATGVGNDVVVGSAASNAISTSGGNDIITGGPGADTLSGGLGDDAFIAQDGFTDSIFGSRGTDRATVDLAGGQRERADVLDSVETITGVELPVVAPLNTPPKLTLTPGKANVKVFARSGIVTVIVSSTEPVSARGAIYARLKTPPGAVGSLAVGDLQVGAGSLGLGTGTRVLKVKVAKAQARALTAALRTKALRRKGIVVRVVVTATDEGGLSVISTQSVRIRG
jgi:Ca2+-binding RTX toxin-like protein